MTIIVYMVLNEIRSQLKSFTVGIAGAGGLGSNCAVSLARSGIGTLVICDYDEVDLSNLNRQYYFTYQQGIPKVEALKEIIEKTGSDTRVVVHYTKLTKDNIPEIFKDCRIIVEALDDANEKEMLIHTVQTLMRETVIVAASGVAGWSDIAGVTCRKVDATLYMCGDQISEVSAGMPALAPKVGAVANLQAGIVIELLMQT